MVVQTAQQAIDKANAQSTCDPGYCLQNVRTWLGIPGGVPDAATAWRDAIGRHPGDKHPPKGAPVFWTGGSAGHGHIALVKGSSMRTTDKPTGKVGNDDGAYPRTQWGLTYAGWAEGFNGVRIPYLGSPWQASGDVYVGKLHDGQADSDSVARLCYRLIHHPNMPGSHRPPKQVRTYNNEILEAVRYWQRNIASGVKGPTDGSALSNQQSNKLFGDAYTVIEK